MKASNFFTLLLFILFSQNAFSQKGMVGEYFNGRDFKEKIMTRVDDKIDFFWNFKAPSNGIAPEDFSVRWTGSLIAPETGEYLIGFVVDDGVRMWINNEMVLNQWGMNDKIFYNAKVNLVAGKSYSLKIEYFNGMREGMIAFKWQLPSQKPYFAGYLGTNEKVIKPNYFGEAQVPKAKPVENKPITTTKPKPIKTEKPIQKPVPVVVAPTPTVTTKPIKDTIVKYIPRNILFEKGTAAMIGNSKQELDNLTVFLMRYSQTTLSIEGHTDIVGDIAMNQTLSEQRANEVKNYLVQKGINANRMTAQGFGGSKPIYLEKSGNSKNRRVAFIIK